MEQLELAVYGKGGIGKSTISANISAALALSGKRVMQIGCDPKHDSTRLLMHGKNIPTVLEYLRDTPKEKAVLEDILWEGFGGIGCIEAGGPRPGVGCAGRGIISAFEFLKDKRAKEQYDLIVYDVLGDVVCGGFAVPVRREYADVIFLVTSGEYMSIYAANNILRGIRNYDGDIWKRVAGIIYNERKVADEDERIRRFADAVGLPVCAKVPRSNDFARAEEQKKTLMELEGCNEIKTIFSRLAAGIGHGMPLYKARPLTDEELEEVVLGTERLYSGNGNGVDEPETAGSAEDCGNLAEGPGSATDCKNMAEETGSAAGCRNLAEEADSYAEGTEEKEESGGINRGFVSETAGIGKNGSAAGAQEVEKENAASEFPADKPSLERPPLYGCAFNGAATAAIHLTDALVLVHSPRACAFYTMQNITSPGRKNLFNRGVLMPSALSPHFACTDMGQTETVFGGMEKLRQCITEAMAKKPGAVVVISSCVSGIIGDDIRDTEQMSTPDCPVITVHADGDVAGDYMEGIRLLTHTMAEHLIDPSVKPEGRRINLIGEAGVSNNHEANFRAVREMLDALDIQVNCRFLGDATAAEVKNFLRAPLNILAADSADNRELKGWLSGRYGCRFMDLALPVGSLATREWLYCLGDIFDCREKAEKLVQRQMQDYLRAAESLKPALEGKRVFMTTANLNIDWLLDTMEAIGMKVVKIGVMNYLRQPVKVTDHPEKYEIDEDFNWTDMSGAIRECRPDLVLSNYTSQVQGDFIADSIPYSPPVGFLSGIQLARRWAGLFQTRQRGGWINDRALFEKYYA